LPESERLIVHINNLSSHEHQFENLEALSKVLTLKT